MKPGKHMGAYFAALPFVLGLVWLALQFMDSTLLVELSLYAGPTLLAGMVLGLPILAGVFWKRGDPHPVARAALIITLLSPLSVVLPWASVPANIGLGLANFAFFVEWLTKYPNFGPINYEVLLGILCMRLGHDARGLCGESTLGR